MLRNIDTAMGAHRRDHFIQSTHDADILLRLREASPADADHHQRNPYAILCIHGAVTPSVVFDVAQKNMSWLNFFADQGVPSFALDLRGYGRSTKPRGMYTPIETSPFDCDHEVALLDIHDAVTFIQRQANVQKVVLVGLSWGGLLSGLYTAQNQDCVHSLVLLAPVHCYKNPLWGALMDPKQSTMLHPSITGYRILHKDTLSAMWSFEIPPGKHVHWQDQELLDDIVLEMLHSDQAWSMDNAKGSIRVPNGVLCDVAKIYNGHEFYKPEDIVVPTLILRGDHDQSSHPKDMEGFFERLGASCKYYYTIGNASHYALIERKAPFMMALVRHFLQDGVIACDKICETKE